MRRQARRGIVFGGGSSVFKIKRLALGLLSLIVLTVGLAWSSPIWIDARCWGLRAERLRAERLKAERLKVERLRAERLKVERLKVEG
jgi:hypothetical protein